MAALYAPLTVANKGFFPLHCDLYIPRTLFSVYEDVSPDQSGASIFLSAKKLVSDILPGMKEMPKYIQSKIVDLLHHNEYADKYEEVYALLHSRLNPSYCELKEKLEAEKFSWKFERGQGYLLHDRKWLHGRTKSNGGLTQKRVHRLVFS